MFLKCLRFVNSFEILKKITLYCSYKKNDTFYNVPTTRTFYFIMFLTQEQCECILYL